MKKEISGEIRSRLEKLPGKIGFIYRNLDTGDSFQYNEKESFMAASVIKLYILAEAVRQCREGIHSKNELFCVRRSSCVPSCGALTYMHDGLNVTIEDLYTLMIILSDNSATNFLIDILGEDAINAEIKRLGFENTQLNRKMFDEEKSSRGIQNYITPAEVAGYFEMLYRGELYDRESADDILRILSDQRLNGKIPFYIHTIPDHAQIAHKTGEDTGITHDAGIIFTEQPILLVFLGNETDVAAYEREMAEISRILYLEAQGQTEA